MTVVLFLVPQVIVFYHHPAADGVPVMWPGSKIPAPWANTTEPSKLIQVRRIQTLKWLTYTQCFLMSRDTNSVGIFGFGIVPTGYISYCNYIIY